MADKCERVDCDIEEMACPESSCSFFTTTPSQSITVERLKELEIGEKSYKMYRAATSDDVNKVGEQRDKITEIEKDRERLAGEVERLQKESDRWYEQYCELKNK